MFNTPCMFKAYLYDKQSNMNPTSSLITSKHTEQKAT